MCTIPATMFTVYEHPLRNGATKGAKIVQGNNIRTIGECVAEQTKLDPVSLKYAFEDSGEDEKVSSYLWDYQSAIIQ